MNVSGNQDSHDAHNAALVHRSGLLRRKHQYVAGDDGVLIDVTPLSLYGRIYVALSMVRWRIKYSRRLLLLRHHAKEIRRAW